MKKFVTIFFLTLLIMLNASAAKADNKKDTDGDGLTDWEESNFFKTDPNKADTDGDTYKDGLEIKNGYSPHNRKWSTKLQKKIEINTKKQELSYYIDGIKINTFKVSTGKATTPTPKGSFKIINKNKRAWSRRYKMWLPYWIGLKDGSFGIHELPEWPNGYKEGKNHIGHPVSHGCIRLAVGPAKQLYEWTNGDTTVIIN